MAGLSRFKINDFSGGLNIRDAPSQLADNEASDCMNVVMDERGGVVKRLGYTKYNAVQLNTAGLKRLYYSETLGIMLCQQGSDLYRTTGGGTWSASVKTFTTSARVDFTDLAGYIVCVHEVDGVWTSTDGTTWTQAAGGANNMEAVRGRSICTWQNKCWVGGDPNNPSRVWACAAGDPRTWTIASAYVDIRDKDNDIVTCVGAGQGMDAVGRPGLLVWKAESCYRINSSDATSGFTYTTLSTSYGAAGPLAVTSSSSGVVAAISHHGIVVTDGVEAPVLVSGKLDPLFAPTQLAYSYLTLMAAGTTTNGHMLFSLTRTGATTNNLTLEYGPEQGWIVPHSFGVADFCTFRASAEVTYGASTGSGYAYRLFNGGSDDGTAIAARFQSKWFDLRNLGLVRLRRLRMAGRGTYSLYVKGDYTTGQGTLCTVSIVDNGPVWGTGTWGVGTWGSGAVVEDFEDFYSLGVAKTVAFAVSESSSLTSSRPALLSDGASETVGAFALYELALDFVPLGYA